MQLQLHTQLQASCPHGLSSRVPLRQPGVARAPLHLEAKQLDRKDRTQRRHKSLRKRLEGSEERPRLSVFKSNNHIYAQVINDTTRHTLVAASTVMPGLKEEVEGHGGNQNAASLVGKKIAELCKQANIEKVCFDRGGNPYHGRIKAVAEAAREGGLAF